MFNGLPLYWTQTDCDFIFPMEDYRAVTHEIEHVEKSSQVVTYGTIYTGHIQHNNDDVIILEVTMTRHKFQRC